MIIDPVRLETPDTSAWRISWGIRGGAGDDAVENLRAERRQGFWPSHPAVSFRLSLTLPYEEGQSRGS